MSVRFSQIHDGYWGGELSHCKCNGAIETYMHEYLKSKKQDCSFLIASIDEVTEVQYNRLTSHVDPRYPVIAGALCYRKYENPALVLVPLDDRTFEYGLAYMLKDYTIPNWESRKAVAFWRGSTTGGFPSARSNVVKKLMRNALCDVKFRKSSTTREKDRIPLSHFAPDCEFNDHFNYKFLFIIDGYSIASNHQWIFLSGAVPIMVTHPDNHYWFQKYLKPMENYVPIKYDLSDLESKIKWLVDNDDQAKIIMENAKKLASEIFTSEFQKKYLRDEIDRILPDKEIPKECTVPQKPRRIWFNPLPMKKRF